jgi:hypothetical protein
VHIEAIEGFSRSLTAEVERTPALGNREVGSDLREMFGQDRLSPAEEVGELNGQEDGEQHVHRDQERAPADIAQRRRGDGERLTRAQVVSRSARSSRTANATAPTPIVAM